MRLEDMPPRLRHAAVAALARDLDRRARRPAAREVAGYLTGRPTSRAAGGGRERYRCGTCGATFALWAPAQRHADGHGGARIALDVTEAAP